MKGIRPSAKHDALRVRFVSLKVQQMADQHLDLRSVTSEALHFFDGVEEIWIDVVVLDNTSGLGSWFFMLCV